MKLRLLVLCALVCVFSVAAFGQAATGTITGTISDPAGAVIAGAPVEVRNTDTNVLYPTQTTAAGVYTVTRLPVGPYSVTVSAPGFKRLVRSGLSVDAGQTLPLDLTLEVGASTESVTVSAEATLLKTETGDVAHNITLQQLDDLPVLGIGGTNAGSSGIRNPFNSSVFLPGVEYTPNYIMVINGAPDFASAYRIEGMDNTNHVVSYALQENEPSPDAIQEMAVQTSNYAPEFGTATGGVFNMTMKSGTNEFHGAGYDYFVNEDLNAGYPYSYNHAGFTGGKYRPINRRNDFGGNLGGPVFIPKVYNGKDKTFFFFNYEYYKENQALSFTDTLPAPAYQNGDFSAISPNGGANFNPNLGVPATAIATDALGRPVFANEIYDPTTRSTAPNGAGVANPFPNNIVPASRFDPTALAIQKLLPASTGALYNNYTGFNAGHRNTTIPSVKIDQSIGPKHKLAFYYQHTRTDSQFSVPNGSDNGLPTLISTARGTFIFSQVERLNYDYTVTPTLLAHLGAGYSQVSFFDDSPYTTAGNTFNCSAINLSGCEGAFNFPTINVNAGGSLPLQMTNPNGATQLGGMTQLGDALAHTHTRSERPSANANLTWVHGSHTYKAGTEVWFQAQITAPPTGVGLTYSSTTDPGATAIPASLVTGAYTEGFPYANFLLGDVITATQYAPVDGRMFKQQWALFVQDSWKINRKLTLTYGVRWDYGTAAHEEYGRSANLGLTTPDPAAGGRLGAPIFEATCHCTFVSAYPYALGPRVGFAYQVTPKTVLRGGWGVVYGFPADISLQNTGDLASSPAGVNAYANIQNPGTIPQPVWPNFTPGQTPLPGQITGFTGFGYLDPNAARPGRQNQWSVGVQREITLNTVIEASYVGNRGVWWPSGAPAGVTGGPYGYLNQVAPSVFAAYGLSPYASAADNLLLGDTLSNAAVISRLGSVVPYSGYSTGNTLINALRPFPQFSTINPINSATGSTWYESLQMKGTRRLSHGLQVNGTFTWSKSLTAIRPNLFVPSVKSFNAFDQPFLFNANILYTTQKWFANKFVATITKDWQLGAFLQYGSGFPLAPPTGTQTNYIGGSEYFRVPGQPLYLKGLNCGCINPYNDVVLNPAAWQVPANGTFGPATGTYYGDFRTARYPSENFNIGRNFRLGHEGRLNLQIRAEFVNIFNRLELGAPSTANPTAPVTHNAFGQLSGGFGVINETVSSFQTAPSVTGNPATGASTGQLYQNPRTGSIIARFSF
jgi:hypothetical protein